MFPRRPLASPRGEAGGDSRLMRWHLAFAVSLRQWQNPVSRAVYYATPIGSATHPRCTAITLPQHSAPHLIRLTSFGNFPSRGRLCRRNILASPRGEAGGDSRLMRWHLAFAVSLRQWQNPVSRAPYAIAQRQRHTPALHCHNVAATLSAPPHPPHFVRQLPLEGKALPPRHPGFPSRGSWRRQPTDEVAPWVCGQLAAVAEPRQPRSLRNRPTAALHTLTTPP